MLNSKNLILNRLSIEGFKSIRELKDFELKKINILIGGNGAGKSNFIELFRLLREMVNRNLQHYILKNGGADGFLFNGPKNTDSIKAHFGFGKNEYLFQLEPTVDEKFFITEEKQKFDISEWKTISDNSYESNLEKAKDDPGWFATHGSGFNVFKAITDWIVYHFHDTSAKAPMRCSEIIEDNKSLRHNAANIAPLLLRLKLEEKRFYNDIVNAVRLVTPFFDDFILEPIKNDKGEKVKLTWKQRGSDYPMQPYHLSDGSIRFISLVTALLQPDLPAIIIIDEPELGLHPFAISILAEMILTIPEDKQIIVSTQSPVLVDYFSPEDVIVVNRKDGASTFERLNTVDFNVWLEDYTLGDLWRKNVVQGGPDRE